MPKLSIIIPVFNVEGYVGKTLASVFDTTASADKFEVIIVNDGTRDRSMDFVRKYATYPNMIIHEQENLGLSAARMNGLSLASGEYVWFVDSDDYLVEDGVEIVLKHLEKTPNVDVLMFPLSREGSLSGEWKKDYLVDEDSLMNGKDIIRNPKMPVWTAARFVVKHSILKNPWVFFPKNLIHEDEYFSAVLLCLSEKVWVMKEPVYIHPSIQGSIMNTLSRRSLTDMIRIHRLEIGFMKEVLSPSDWEWFRPFAFDHLMGSYKRFPHTGIEREGFYMWRAWKDASPGRSLKSRIGKWIFFVMPGVFNRYMRLIRK